MYRKEALAQNLSVYYTDKPCKRGHFALRRTKSGVCLACQDLNHRHWRQNNKGRVNSFVMRRIASKIQATPTWSETVAIRELYEACPTGMEVDHIVPLRSSVVCGLHVLANLQYLTKEQNSRKGNKL